jgi:hypothetical protein
LTVLGGLAALSPDAMASVVCGPEAIVLVLALAGLGFTVSVTLAIAALLVVLTLSSREVTAAFPKAAARTGCLASTWARKWPGTQGSTEGPGRICVGALRCVEHPVLVASSISPQTAT